MNGINLTEEEYEEFQKYLYFKEQNSIKDKIESLISNNKNSRNKIKENILKIKELKKSLKNGYEVKPYKSV